MIEGGARRVEIVEARVAEVQRELKDEAGVEATKDDLMLMAFTKPGAFGGCIVAQRQSRPGNPLRRR